MTTKSNTKTTSAKSNKTQTKTTVKAQTKPETKTESKPKRVSIESKADLIRHQLMTTESVQFENADTAVNRENSATILEKNAIMLTLVSAESNQAHRVLEIWAHANRNDVCISKKLFERLTTETEDSDAIQRFLARTLNGYRSFIDPAGKSSKYVFRITTLSDTINLANYVTLAL